MPHNWSVSSFFSFSARSAMIAVAFDITPMTLIWQHHQISVNWVVEFLSHESKVLLLLFKILNISVFLQRDNVFKWPFLTSIEVTVIIADLVENDENKDLFQLCGICWKWYYVLFQIPMLLYLWTLDINTVVFILFLLPMVTILTQFSSFHSSI